MSADTRTDPPTPDPLTRDDKIAAITDVVMAVLKDYVPGIGSTDRRDIAVAVIARLGSLAALPVREDEPTGIDVERLARLHPSLAVRNAARTLLDVIDSEREPGWQARRLTREASHVR